MFFDIARILRYCEPRGFILENVDYLERHDGGNTYRVITQTLENLGYHVTAKVLDSLNFGIPQQRKRIFIVGHINKEISLDGHINKVSTFSDIMEQGLETYDSKFTKKYSHSIRRKNFMERNSRIREAGQIIFIVGI